MTDTNTKPPLDPHLKALENEAIYIFREVAAEFQNPVMLYSVGKDSSVLLHLAQGIFSRTYPVSASARKHRMEIYRNDRLPRPNCGGLWS